MPEPERLVIFGLPGGADVRSVSFPHTTHMEAGCAQCHEVERAMNADEVDCVSCHVEHHESETECAACHNTPPSWAHEEDLVHATCTGSVCHTTFPAAEPWWTCSVCLACHEELRDEPFDPRPPAPDTVP
jgi:glutaredoxin